VCVSSLRDQRKHTYTHTHTAVSAGHPQDIENYVAHPREFYAQYRALADPLSSGQDEEDNKPLYEKQDKLIYLELGTFAVQIAQATQTKGRGASEEAVLDSLSPKLQKLCEVLRLHSSSREERYCCIIFVERKVTARLLALILNTGRIE
jgi:hypothetical protein